MEIEVDHYRVLGLLSGEEGSKLSQNEISKGYRLKARELHPDKRPDDPNANSDFQKLQISYGILSDENARRFFDDLLRVRRQQSERKEQLNSKRQKMVSDLEMRERAAAFAADAAAKEKEEEMIYRKLSEEIARIKAMQTSKVSSSWSKRGGGGGGGDDGGGGFRGLDRMKVLKVSWDRGVANCYNSKRIREIFERFGRVEDVVIRSSKWKGSAIVVLDSVDAVAAAAATVCGDHSNPLLVLPLQPVAAVKSEFGVAVPGQLDKLVGAGYQDFEDSVLKKFQKASEKQKLG